MAKYSVKVFEKARDYLSEIIDPILNVCFMDPLDPWMVTIVKIELDRLINRTLIREFPGLPLHLIPRYTSRVLKNVGGKNFAVDLSIQHYVNEKKGLSFLGNHIHGDVCHDLYCAPYYDGTNTFIFYARYDHRLDSFTCGASSARSQYHLGLGSPLSVAYGMAVHDGYING